MNQDKDTGELLNSDDLRLFRRVAAAGSLTRASIALGLPVSTISRKLATCEERAGTLLFRRTGRGLELTAQGALLHEHAAKVEASLREALDVLSSSVKGGPDKITIASQPTIARMVFGRIIESIGRTYPRTRIRLVEGLAGQISAWLADGEVDIALIYTSTDEAGHQFTPIAREPLHVVCASAAPFDLQALTFRDIPTLPLIIPGHPHGIRVLAERFAREVDVPLNVRVECDASVSITKQLVVEGCGVTILPLAAVQDEVNAGRVRTHAPNHPMLIRKICIALPTGNLWDRDRWGIAQLLRGVVDTAITTDHWRGASAL